MRSARFATRPERTRRATRLEKILLYERKASAQLEKKRRAARVGDAHLSARAESHRV